MVQFFWKTGWQLFKMLSIELLYVPAVVLGICPKEMKTYVHTKTFTQMFITALLLIVKNGKQPRSASMGE